jgi:hypothetical protein
MDFVREVKSNLVQDGLLQHARDSLLWTHPLVLVGNTDVPEFGAGLFVRAFCAWQLCCLRLPLANELPGPLTCLGFGTVLS